MADSTIAALTAATTLDGTELYYGVQAGGDTKVTGTQIKTLVLAGATTQLGDGDAAAPVAQTLRVQSVVTGTSNTAGADWTIAGSKGTGTGVPGVIIFKNAPAGGSGTSQNALTTTMTVGNTVSGQENGVVFASRIAVDGASLGAAGVSIACVGGVNAGSGFVLLRQVSPLFGQTSAQFAAGGSGHISLFAANAVPIILLGDGDAAAPVAQTLRVQSVVAGTTDTAGTDWTRIASKGTGTGAGGNLINQTAFSAKSTGTGQGTAVDRHIVVAKGKVLTSAAAFAMFDVALPTLTMCGGVIEATIVCTDGTDMQSFTQTVTYSSVNKGGVYTTSITASTGDKSVSAGTLTTSWTIVSGSNKVTIKVTPTTSLTPSTNAFLLYYTVRNNSEQATTIL